MSQCLRHRERSVFAEIGGQRVALVAHRAAHRCLGVRDSCHDLTTDTALDRDPCRSLKVSQAVAAQIWGESGLTRNTADE